MTCVLIKEDEICKGVVLEMQVAEIIEDFLPLELGSLDVILGVK